MATKYAKLSKKKICGKNDQKNVIIKYAQLSKNQFVAKMAKKYAKLNRKQFVAKLAKKMQNSGCDKHDHNFHKRYKINQKTV